MHDPLHCVTGDHLHCVTGDHLHCVTGDHLINRVVARHKPFSYALSAMTQYIVLGERGSMNLEPS
jgi:hypothetical protein